MTLLRLFKRPFGRFAGFHRWLEQGKASSDRTFGGIAWRLGVLLPSVVPRSMQARVSGSINTHKLIAVTSPEHGVRRDTGRVVVR